jgi:hypothetical protein
MMEGLRTLHHRVRAEVWNISGEDSAADDGEHSVPIVFSVAQGA